MPALKKLIAPGQSLPPARILVDSSDANGKTTPVDVKEVKDKNGNLLWGRYDVNTEQLDMYCETYNATFTTKYFNGSYSNSNYSAVGVPENRTLNITNVGDSNICYYGETLKYILNVPAYYYLGTEGGRWVRTVDYSTTITSDLTLYPPSFTDVIYSKLISVTASYQGSQGEAATLFRAQSPLKKAPTGKFTPNSTNSNVYYKDILGAQWNHNLSDVLPVAGKEYHFILENKGVNLLPYTATYITYANQSTSINIPVTTPIYFYSAPVWTATAVNNTESSSNKIGYELKATLGLNPLAFEELDSLVLNFYCSSAGQHFKIGTNNVALSAGTSGKVSKDWVQYGITWNTTTNSGWLSASEGTPINNISLLSVSRPAYWTGSPEIDVTYNYPMAKAALYAIYSWQDTFWNLDFLNGTHTKVTSTTTVTGSGWMGLDYQYSNELKAGFPNVIITAPIAGSGKIKATVTLSLRDSGLSEVDRDIILTKTVDFTNLSQGVSVLESGSTNGAVVSSDDFSYIGEINSEWCGTFYLDYEIELEGGIKHKGAQISWSVNDVQILE